MFGVPLITLAPVPLVLAACATLTVSNPSPRETRSEDNAMIALGKGYAVLNNVWNKGATSGPYKESVFREGRPADSAVFGWEWQWPSSTNVVAYPEVIYGTKPWGPDLGTVDGLPLQIGSRNLTARFDIELDAHGFYNMAFELWFVSGLPPSPQKITHEIMIWNVNHYGDPAGIRVDTVTIGGVVYDVFVREGHGDASGKNANRWTYIAFSARTPVLKGFLPLGSFIDYLLARNILNRNLYITSVELGNEIMEGDGKVRVKDYAIDLN